MAENLLNKLINNEIDSKAFHAWLRHANPEDSKYLQQTLEYQCSRTDFITYFLNYIHENVARHNSEVQDDDNKSTPQSSGDTINKSHSFPLDLSAELNSTPKSSTSTPKVTKVQSESVLNHMSPISPLYKIDHSFTTPKTSRRVTPQRICLGDFIINKRTSSQKKKSNKTPDESIEIKRRIKPTNLDQNRINSSSFNRTENSFNFNRSDIEQLPDERNLLVEETLKILPPSLNLNRSISICSSNNNSACEKIEIEPDLNLVTHKNEIDEIVKIYTALIECNFILNLGSEVYFLITLLLKRQFDSFNNGLMLLSDRIQVNQLFQSIHNIVYFASKCLEKEVKILMNFDSSTIKLLSDNARLRRFAPALIIELQLYKSSDNMIELSRILQDNVCFNSDTDNRQNFPNDASFHAFRKQRDLFYEILRIWEQHRLSPGFSYAASLSGKIKTLLSLSVEATNFMHFARLFKAQLLSTCGKDDSEGTSNLNFIEALGVDKAKLNRLKSRCETKESQGSGLNSLLRFSDREEFYRDFILVALNHCFVKHLIDALVEEILELNEGSFICDLDEGCDVDTTTRKSFYVSLMSLRVLAKFQGFLDSLPYKTDVEKYSERVLSAHLQIRNKVHPNFDIKTILQASIRRKTTILCIPWLTTYLSMLDSVTLKLPYYTAVLQTLFWLYRNIQNAPPSNIYLIKFCLGWLFELPNFPELNYFEFCNSESKAQREKLTASEINGFSDVANVNLDQLEIVDRNVLHLCCPFLDEIKKLLTMNFSSNSYTTKHIRPVTALQSPDEIARKRLQQQLEEAFFNGQPISVRKTVEFVSERIASACVKHICANIVPNFKKIALDRLKQTIIKNEESDLSAQKMAALKSKATQLSTNCLSDLQVTCQNEIESLCTPKITQAIESLVSFDTLPETVAVCVGITKKICVERVKQWMNTHVTAGIFSKDFNDEIQKVATGGYGKKLKKPLFILPAGGSKTDHNELGTTSGVHLLEKLRELCIDVLEQSQLNERYFSALLRETIKSCNERGDISECVSASICTVLLELSLLLLAHNFEVMSKTEILQSLLEIWKSYYSDTDDLFKSLLCKRNVMILAQSNDVKLSWKAFAKFCAYLFENNVISRDNFESQCTGIFKTEWDEASLKNITDFFKEFVRLCKDDRNSGDFTFLLDFLSDYCEDL